MSGCAKVPVERVRRRSYDELPAGQEVGRATLRAGGRGENYGDAMTTSDKDIQKAIWNDYQASIGLDPEARYYGGARLRALSPDRQLRTFRGQKGQNG